MTPQAFIAKLSEICAPFISDRYEWKADKIPNTISDVMLFIMQKPDASKPKYRPIEASIIFTVPAGDTIIVGDIIREVRHVAGNMNDELSLSDEQRDCLYKNLNEASTLGTLTGTQSRLLYEQLLAVMVNYNEEKKLSTLIA